MGSYQYSPNSSNQNYSSDGGGVIAAFFGGIIYLYFFFTSFWIFSLTVLIVPVVVARFVVFRLTNSRLISVIAAVAPIFFGIWLLTSFYVRETENPVRPDAQRELGPLSEVFQSNHLAYSPGLVYRVLENRLYIGTIVGAQMDFLEADTSELRHTWLPGLEKNLRRQLQKLYQEAASDESARKRLRSLFSKSDWWYGDAQKLIIADGDLVNFNFQQFFPGKEVIRTFTTNVDTISKNLSEMSGPIYLDRNNTVIINGLPQNEEELRHLGFPSDDLDRWTRVAQRFDDAIGNSHLRIAKTAKGALNALGRRRAVIFVIAHSDGYSISMANGESITVRDIEAFRPSISNNRPIVFLFSCETANETKLDSMAKSLIENGATMVVAPVSKVEAYSALKLLQAFLDRCLKNGLDVHSALTQSITQTQVFDLERWIAEYIGPPDMKPSSSVRSSDESLVAGLHCLRHIAALIIFHETASASEALSPCSRSAWGGDHPHEYDRHWEIEGLEGRGNCWRHGPTHTTGLKNSWQRRTSRSALTLRLTASPAVTVHCHVCRTFQNTRSFARLCEMGAKSGKMSRRASMSIQKHKSRSMLLLTVAY